MPLLTPQRFKSSSNGTLVGMSVQGRYVGFTLEDESRKVKVHEETVVLFLVLGSQFFPSVFLNK